MMDFVVGVLVEVVDQFGIWVKVKVVLKFDNLVVVIFFSWRFEWDREICDFFEIRDETIKETLIFRYLG